MSALQQKEKQTKRGKSKKQEMRVSTKISNMLINNVDDEIVKQNCV